MPAIIFNPDSHVTIAYEQPEDKDAPRILPVTVYSTDPKWDQVVGLLRETDYEGIRSLMNETANNILSYGNGRVTIEGGCVVLDGDNPVEGVMIDRMLAMLDLELDIEPLALFLVNLYENPDYRAVNESYGFIEASDLTITSDGHLLAYKRVRENYMDIHSGTFDNSIGSICKMPRNKVDPDKNSTCSDGLHFCGRDYLPSFGTWGNGYRTMVVKVNPRDIVSVPVDYKNHKARCCLYEVVGELENDGMHLEGTVTTDYDDVDENVLVIDVDWVPEDDMDEEGEQIDDPSATKTVKHEFTSRAAARTYVSHNPGFVVRDRGPGVANRWYVARRS